MPALQYRVYYIYYIINSKRFFINLICLEAYALKYFANISEACNCDLLEKNNLNQTFPHNVEKALCYQNNLVFSTTFLFFVP